MTKRTSHLSTALKQAAADTGLPITSWEVQRLATAQLCLQQLQHRLNAGNNVGPGEINSAIEAVEAARQAAKKVEPLKLDVRIVHPTEMPAETMCHCCGSLFKPEHPENVLRANKDLREYYGLTDERWSDGWRDRVIAKPPPLQSRPPRVISEPVNTAKPAAVVQAPRTTAAPATELPVQSEPLPLIADPNIPNMMQQPPSAESRSINAASATITNPDTGERVTVLPPLKKWQQSATDESMAREHARIARNNDPRTASYIEPYKQFPIV